VSTDTVQVNAASRAVYVAFIFCGVSLASWASRIPQVRDGLGLSPSQLGLVLLAIAAGSILSLLAAGQVVAKFGSKRTVAVMAGVLGVALTVVAVGYQYGVFWVVLGLFMFGFANGAWDVAMNVQGAIVERRLGRAIMPRYHAGFSVGTVAGALIGAGVIALGLSVTVHLIITAVVVAVTVAVAVQSFGPDTEEEHAEAEEETGLSRTLATWREPRTLLVGVLVLAFAFAEGTGIDWISVAIIDDYGAPATVGTLAFALFLAAMTIGRWFGPGLLDRYGRVAVVRGLAVISLFGLLLFVFGWNTPIGFVGALFWGLGASLGFPVGMSAAADDPKRAAPRVSVVASIGYCAFLGGPPLVGFLGDHITVQKGLISVAVLLGVALLVAGALKPLQPAEPRAVPADDPVH
jgi:predicted MFS family arabinose efflux permease